MSEIQQMRGGNVGVAVVGMGVKWMERYTRREKALVKQGCEKS